MLSQLLGLFSHLQWSLQHFIPDVKWDCLFFYSDPVVIFQASLSCSHLLLSSGGGGHMTVMGMLRNGRTLMAMASLMFAPVPLEEVVCCECVNIMCSNTEMSSDPPIPSGYEQCQLWSAVVCGPCHLTQGSQCLSLSQGSSLSITSNLLQPCTLSGYLCIPATAGQ